MLWLILYALILTGIGVYHMTARKVRSVEGFVVYERKAGWFSAGMSLTALVFGASAVFGMAGFAYNLGWNAIWWTLSGVICLWILVPAFVKNVWETRGFTLSDIIAKVFGENIRFFVSLIIFIAWLVILAAQIIAGANITGAFIRPPWLAAAVFTLIFTGYTFLAGQAGALKSGFLQTFLMIAGLAVILLLCWFSPGRGSSNLPAFGLNSTFTLPQFLAVFIPVGLSSLFGPDIYSRIFSSENPDQARKGILFGSGLILFTSVIIVGIGILSRGILGNIANPDQVITLLVPRFLHGALSDLALVALISIPLSGADIMLITTSTLLTKDIIHPVMRKIGKKSGGPVPLSLLRGVIAGTAALAAVLAMNLKFIIPSLMAAYKIFAVGIVPLLLISLLAIKSGLVFKTGLFRVIIGIYLALTSIMVLLIETKALRVSIVNYNLWLILINTVVLFTVFMLAGLIKKAIVK
jgi:Na+/proline symporter